MPKVSVIMPNYNHARYLKERMDSILAQDYPDFEVILLDESTYSSLMPMTSSPRLIWPRLYWPLTRIQPSR